MSRLYLWKFVLVLLKYSWVYCFKWGHWSLGLGILRKDKSFVVEPSKYPLEERGVECLGYYIARKGIRVDVWEMVTTDRT